MLGLMIPLFFVGIAIGAVAQLDFGTVAFLAAGVSCFAIPISFAASSIQHLYYRRRHGASPNRENRQPKR